MATGGRAGKLGAAHRGGLPAVLRDVAERVAMADGE